MMTDLRQLGEEAIIKKIASIIPTRADVAVGIGDDAAVVTGGDSPFDWLLTSDPVIEGIHFLPHVTGSNVGNKAIGRVLSDIAAMGGDPLWLLINLVAPDNVESQHIEEIYKSAVKTASRYGAIIVGGDITQGNTLAMHVFATGRVPHGSAVLRSGARAGDIIYVTGSLGCSIEGKHLTFSPRVEEGRWLRAEGWVHAMTDISDGLIKDLRQLTECSEVGAHINIDDLPLSEITKQRHTGESQYEHALCDGEDYELLFTVAPQKAQPMEEAWHLVFDTPCTAIGTVTESSRDNIFMKADGSVYSAQKKGFNHFS